MTETRSFSDLSTADLIRILQKTRRKLSLPTTECELFKTWLLRDGWRRYEELGYELFSDPLARRTTDDSLREAIRIEVTRAALKRLGYPRVTGGSRASGETEFGHAASMVHQVHYLGRWRSLTSALRKS